MKRFAVTGIVLALALATACGGGGESSEPTTSETTSSTGPTQNDQAAAAFIAAWSRGHSAAMRQIADGAVVDAALRLGDAHGPPECSSQGNGQYQCIVAVSAGKRAYILVGEPGARAGRVWWVAEYNPSS